MDPARGFVFSKLNRPWSPFIYFRARSYLPELYFWPTLFFSRFLRRRMTPNLAPPDVDFSRETRPRSSGIKTYEYLTDRAVLNLSYACTPLPLPEEKLPLMGPGGLAPENSLGFFWSRARLFSPTRSTKATERDKCLPPGKKQPLLVARRSRREEDKNSKRRPTFSNSGVLDNEVINRDANYREGIHHGGCGGKIMNR